jgi:3'-phosphoadenosine 5'-phosphosulfate sulfotransferase (PAPS reductase)/FAD synthetase
VTTELYPRLDPPALKEEALEILAKAKERFQPVATFALFSGGNDSRTALDVVRHHIDAVVHIVTGIGIPQTTEYVRKACDDLGLPLIELRTDPSVYVGIVMGANGYPHKNGFPGPAAHGICYQRLKDRRIDNIQRDFTKRGQRVLLVSGVRSHESKRRKMNTGKNTWTAPTARRRRIAFANPIVAWDSRDMISYREHYGIDTNPVAALIHKSGECLCGAFAQKGELEEVGFWFPETGKYIRDLEREAEKAGKPYCRWGWGHDKRAGVPAPGPMCQGCQLF